MRIFFSVGEPSGDVHGANLIRELRRQRSDLEFVGYGGPEMASAGCRLHADLTQFAVMWLLRVIVNLHKFLGLLVAADRSFRLQRPDAVVLIDYPGFNWWIARRARAHGIPVFYYGTPQLWAWARWRVAKMRRLVDHALCKLPFEEAWYRERGINATFVGHPFFDEVRRYQLDREFLARLEGPGQLVAILPGSRTQEVLLNFSHFVAAARHIHKRVPNARFAVAAFKPQHAELAHKIIADAKLPADFPIEVYTRRTPELIRAATCCLAVSGSVSLELLHHAKPTVILYWITPLANWLQSYIRKVKYITLVNLLTTGDLERTDRKNFEPSAPGADHVPFPEYVTSDDRSADIAEHAIEWLTQPAARQKLVDELIALRDRVGAGGASQAAATYICRELNRLAPAATTNSTSVRAA